MNIYKQLNEKQIKLVEEAGQNIENREYSEEEIRQVANVVANHIFSKSGVRIDIWTHFMRGCIIELCTPI